MPLSPRALWECPKCGRQFANRRQWHGCTRLTVADCLKGKSARTIDLYNAFETAVRACGRVRIHPTKARIGFIARMTFAGAKLRKDCIEAGILLPYPSHSPRFFKFFPYRAGGVHFLLLEAIEQIDEEVNQWLAEAYRVGLQEPTSPLATWPTVRASVRPERSRRRRSHSKRRRTGKVFYIHFQQEELQERMASLRAFGHQVDGHASTVTTARLGADLPDVFVISLDRLPSHGRAYAGWFWEAKKRQGIPIIFCGGQPEKVQITRAQFPDAVFCATDEVAEVVSDTLPAPGHPKRQAKRRPKRRAKT